jgi:hypothetical protein
MSEEPLTYERNWERVHCTYSHRYLKRSLAPSEYKTTPSGDLYVPFRNRERLENEVACLKFIGEQTDIPVPKVLDAYEENGSFLIWTEFIKCVPMKELKEEDRLNIMPEIRRASYYIADASV